MIRLAKTVILIALLSIATWFGAHWYAEYRVRSAFAEAGMSDRAAACMGKRLVRKLSLVQVRKLTAFQDEPHTVGGLVRAVRKVADRKVIAVTTSSVALCTAGIAS